MSKDKFADPEEVRAIEDKFSLQDNIINNIKGENNDLVNAYNMKEEEVQQLRQLASDMENKQKRNKDAAK